MKRDLDLIRKILLAAEEAPPLGRVSDIIDRSKNDEEERKIIEHVLILSDAGLVQASFTKDSRGFFNSARIERLTWAGHEFLSASKDPTVWEKVRDRVMLPSVSWTFGLLTEMMKEEAKNRLGILIG